MIINNSRFHLRKLFTKKGWSEVATIIVLSIAIVILVAIVLIISFSLELHFKIYKNESGEIVEFNEVLNISKQNLTVELLEENCEDITSGMSTQTFKCEDYLVDVWSQIK